jgi:spore protease
MMKSNIYTDLAIESAREADKDGGGIDGVTVESETFDGGGINVTWVKVLNDNGAAVIGKPIGNYITVESGEMKGSDVSWHEKITVVLTEYLSRLIKINGYGTILVAGLGNRMVTPDALGPRAASKILVTRHIMDTLPDETRAKTRPVSALSPGVMGTTGIETREIIKGVCEHIKPALVIVIDALAARAANRINSTIQLSDTGLAPGGGMNNDSPPKTINEEFLGVPVIAIGVPTVVDAATLVNDALDLALDSMISELPEAAPFYAMLKDLQSGDKYTLVKRLLEPYTGNMFVTPKEIDETVENLACIIANAVNIASQPGMDLGDMNRF